MLARKGRDRGSFVIYILSAELVKQVEAHDEKLEEQVTAMVTDCERQLKEGFQLVAKFTQHMADW